MIVTDKKIQKPKRVYFNENLNISSWREVENVAEEMKAQRIGSPEELIRFIQKYGELENIVSEEAARRYIDMTRYADDEEKGKAFHTFYSSVVSRLKPYDFVIKKKIFEHPSFRELPEKEYGHLKKIFENDMALFREENIPLQVKEAELSTRYGSVNSKITAVFDGEEKTLSQLGVYQKDPNRAKREKAWRVKMEAFGKAKEELDSLFDQLKEIRIQQALNAGFDNYRDYKHQELGRFTYTPQEILEFHDAVEHEVIPFLKELNEKRKAALSISSVRPWDTAVDLDGKALRPFSGSEELAQGAIRILNDVKGEYAARLEMMKNSGLLDLENRKGKAPGGYNYPLAETKAPFIFMNAVGLHRDAVTLLHESGHAMHTFATRDIKITPYLHTPSEVAELASMGMEFLTMDHWGHFYKDESDLAKAMRDQLEGALTFLPWCMIVDAFQHWVYTHPKHTPQERDAAFASLMERFNPGVDWSGLEKEMALQWMYQLHIFQAPFYYIEYGMAQLGALALYRNYKSKGKDRTLKEYDAFLSKGYSCSVEELYETAGLRFRFTRDYLKEIVEFTREALEQVGS
ncbi:MAG TPA: M3 family oligoendopeptidase [Firmicutes bacterium]|nr:M3 family oligoendopeptidase [Bacillota bacterium]